MTSPPNRWAPLAGFALVSSANQMAWLTFAPVATGAAARYGVSTSAIGALSEVFPLVYVVLALPASRALERSFRGWLGAGAVLTAVGALARLGGTAKGGFAWVVAGQVVISLAQPLLLNAVLAIARAYLAPRDRPTGIAVASAGTYLGFVLAFVTGGIFGAGHIGLLLVVGAAYASVGAAVLVATLRAAPSNDDPAQPLGLDEVRRLWRDPVMRGLTYFVFVGFGVFVALVTWVQALLAPAGVTTSATDTLLIVMVVAGIPSSVALPPFVARRGTQLPALVVAGVATVIGCLVLAVAPGVPGAAVALVTVGLLLLPGMPVMLEVAERNTVAGPAAGAGLLWLAGNAGGIVVAGLVDAVEGTPWAAFCLMAAVILCAVPTAARLKGKLSAPVPRV